MAGQRKFISFFAGARGLDIGLENAGWRCIAANEYDAAAIKTVQTNDPKLRLYSQDIRTLQASQLLRETKMEPEELFAVVGGPPCQAFSTAGRRNGLNDERGNVFLQFLDIISVLRPKYAIFENVRGLLSTPLKHRPHSERGALSAPLVEDELPGGALRLILHRLEDFGYRTTFNLYNMANFGIPQKRERLIFIASRDGEVIPHLRPTHDKEGRDGLAPWISFREAVSEIQNVAHHFSQFPEKRLSFYRLLKAGQNWRDLPEWVLPEAMGESLFAGGGKTGFYRRLSWDDPAPTLVTRPNMKATDLCHPKELRPLSVEEYAAIQTFPVDYKFSGTLDDQYRQIGNAVPCRFGEAIAKHVNAVERGDVKKLKLLTNLSRYKRTDEKSWPGAATAKSFAPLLQFPESDCA